MKAVFLVLFAFCAVGVFAGRRDWSQRVWFVHTPSTYRPWRVRDLLLRTVCACRCVVMGERLVRPCSSYLMRLLAVSGTADLRPPGREHCLCARVSASLAFSYHFRAQTGPGRRLIVQPTSSETLYLPWLLKAANRSLTPTGTARMLRASRVSELAARSRTVRGNPSCCFVTFAHVFLLLGVFTDECAEFVARSLAAGGHINLSPHAPQSDCERSLRWTRCWVLIAMSWLQTATTRATTSFGCRLARAVPRVGSQDHPQSSCDCHCLGLCGAGLEDYLKHKGWKSGGTDRNNIYDCSAVMVVGSGGPWCVLISCAVPPLPDHAASSVLCSCCQVSHRRRH